MKETTSYDKQIQKIHADRLENETRKAEKKSNFQMMKDKWAKNPENFERSED